MPRQKPRLPRRPGVWLKNLLTGLARHAEGDLRRIPSAPAENIHALRTRMKKLHALLRLANHHVPPETSKNLRQRMRDIKNAFTESRDAEVMQKLVARMSHQRRMPPLEEGVPEMGMPDASTVPADPLVRQVVGQVATLRRALNALPLQSLTWRDVISAYSRRYRACRRALRRCEKDPDPKLFHRWRRPVKELYYMSLALHALPGVVPRIAPTRELGSLLGREHDLILLHDKASGAGADEWHREIAKRVEKLHRRIFALAEDLFAQPRRKVRKALEREACPAGDQNDG